MTGRASSGEDPFLDDDTLLHPGTAVAAILVAPDRRYLLQLRDGKRGIFFPGHWGCFGGALEATDADFEAGLRRELREELQLHLSPGAVAYFTNMTFDLAFCGVGVIERTFYEATLSDAQLAGLRLGEGSALRLFSAREALSEPRLTPYDRFALWLHASRNRLGPAPEEH